MDMYQSVEFEKLVADILVSVGYNIEDNIDTRKYDIRAKKDGQYYNIECKLSSNGVLSHMKHYFQEEIIYILPFKDEIEKVLLGAWYCGKEIPHCQIWDVSDLQKMLEAVYNSASETQRDRIINIFKKLNDFTNKYYNKNLISGIIFSLNRETIQKLYDEFKNDTKNSRWRKFEEFFMKFVEFYFYGYIGRLIPQKITDGGLHRYDAIAPVVLGKTDSNFLDIVKNCFHCRYIIFEAKCYNKRITQSEIWRTSKYLHKAALRNVAILITSSICDRHCKAIQYGLLREQDKLIIVLDGHDINKILNATDKIIEDVLKQKIDDLMMSMIA